jgi:hypothetical protein
MSNLTPRIDRIERTAYGSEIEVGKISAPYTTIKNEQGQPRKISDLANNMKVHMGTERIHATSPKKVNNEFGPNGEPIYSNQNSDERIRLVGAGWRSRADTTGSRIRSDNINDYVEITFYGTGLNLITRKDAGARDYFVSVDGGVEGSDIYGAAKSSVLE